MSNQLVLAFCQGPVVEVWSVTSGVDLAVAPDFHELHLPGNNTPVAVHVRSRILDGVLQIAKSPRLVTGIGWVDKHSATAQQLSVAFQKQVYRRIQQRVARANEFGQCFTRKADEVLLERDTLVFWKYW